MQDCPEAGVAESSLGGAPLDGHPLDGAPLDGDDAEAALLRARTRRLDSFAEPDAQPDKTSASPSLGNGVVSPGKTSKSPLEQDVQPADKTSPSPAPCPTEMGPAELLALKPPVVHRRDQLNSDFRKKAEDEAEDDGDGEQDEGDVDMTACKKPAAKAKTKANPKTQKPTRKAKAAPKKPSPKAKGAAKSRAKKPTSNKSPKKSQPKAQDDKGASKQKASKKAVAGDEGQVENENGAGGSKRAKRGSANTWARRYPPSDPTMLLRYRAIKEVFDTQIGPLLRKQSAFQDSLFQTQVKLFFFPNKGCPLRL